MDRYLDFLGTVRNSPSKHSVSEQAFWFWRIYKRGYWIRNTRTQRSGTHKVDKPLHRIFLRPDALAAIKVVGHGFGLTSWAWVALRISKLVILG